MNRAEFMQQLGALLGDLPINERTEALKYYADYFDDAGSENEEQVIKELGSPQEVAGIIKAELNAKDKESGEFTEKGYKNPAYTTTAAPTPAASQNSQTNGSDTANNNAQSNQGTYTPKQNSAGKTALIVVLCILLIPVGIPFAIAVVSTVFSLIVAIFSTIFGLIIGCAAVTLALFIAAIILLIIAFFNITGMPLVSLVLIGAALLTAALAILFMLLTVLLCGKALPAIFKGIVYVCGYPFRKKEVVV